MRTHCTNPLRRYYCRLNASDPTYLQRPDESMPVPIADLGLQPTEVSSFDRPGFSTDTQQLQWAQIGLQFFMQGVSIVPPSATSRFAHAAATNMKVTC